MRPTRCATFFLLSFTTLTLCLAGLVPFALPHAHAQDAAPWQTVAALHGIAAESPVAVDAQTVRVAGYAGSAQGAVLPGRDFYLQHDGRALRLVTVPAEPAVAAGDSVVVTGTVAFENGRPVLRVQAMAAYPRVAVELKPRRLPYAALDLTPFEGLDVQTQGRLLRKGRDARGPFLVVHREGGPVLVRGTQDEAVAALAFQPFQPGDHLSLAGTLVPAAAGPAVTHAVLVREAGDVATALLPRAWWPWAGGGVLAVVMLLMLAFVGLRKVRGGRVNDRYLQIFQQSADPMVITDAQLRVRDANETMARLLRRKRRTLRREPLTQLVACDGPLDAQALAQQVAQEGTATFDACLPGRDGEATHFEVTLSRIDTNRGAHLLAVLHDTSAHEAGVARYETFIEQLIDAAPLQVVILSVDGRYQYVNPQVISNDRVRQMLIGKTDFDYCKAFDLHMEIALRRRSYRKQAVDTRAPVTFEEAIPSRDGTVQHFNRVYVPHVDAEGEVSMLISFGIEETERRKLRADLSAARDEAEKMTRLKSAFLQNISHEFRTPLTGIVGFAQILKEEVQDDLMEFVDSIISGGTRLMDTLNVMLDMAGLEAEQVDLNPQVLNLVAEVQEAVRTLEPTAKEKNLFLRVQPEAPELLARLDQACLHRVLNNLVGNALKFTDTGGVVVEVSHDADRVFLRVMDSGVGIDGTFMPELFKAFNQEEAGVDRSFEGVGLGLAVSKQLVRLMGGEIEVHSEKGQGSMFTVSFPSDYLGQGAEDWLRPEVLVVDAQPEMQRMAAYLAAPHYRTAQASSLAQAIDLARRTRYAAILVDADLDAERTRGELLHALRTIEGYEQVPVIAADAQPVPGSHAQLLRAGFDHYVSKPYKKLALLNALADVVPEHEEEAEPEQAPRPS